MTSTQRKPNLNHELNTTKWFEKSYVVAIGINKYIAPIDSLNTAVNDAQAITGVLEEKHGFEKLDCLLDEDATLSNIRTLLTRLKTTIGKNDRLIFYFAGHGIADSNESEPEGYLIPQDAKFPEEKTYLSMTDLLKALSEIDCRHVLMILDCCHAGAIKWALKTRQSGRAKQIYPTTLDLYINTPAWQILTSSDEDQEANDRRLKNSRDQDVDLSKLANHSPFAYCLIQGLQGKADLFPPENKDGIITAEELHLYLRQVDIETGTSNSKKRQTPLLLPFPKKPGKGEFVFLLNDYERIKGDLEKNSPDPEINDENNPYRGLDSYESIHADIFFGRTRAIEDLCDQVSTSPLTVVLGTSGSGKSSLVKAGLIPHLRRKIEDLKQSELFIPSEETQKHYEKPQHQHAVLAKENSQVIRPGKSPGTTLEKALADLNLKAIPSGIKCLLVIDQFEEVETQCQDKAEQDKFWQQLVSLLRVEQFRSKLSLVLTLRTDFESLLRSKFEAAWENWEKQVPKPEAQKLGWISARFLVKQMEPQELQEVIEGPAAVKGVYFETKPRERTLVQELVHEVDGMPGALPLLSFALQEIYRKLAEEFVQAKKEGAEPPKREIGWRHYDSLKGGVTESITRRATEEYEALVKEGKADEQTIRNVMLRMVAVGGGELARRQVLLSELEYPPEKQGSVDEVIYRFTNKARLLVTGKDSEGNRCVEPAHDALVRVWPKLVEWKRKEQANLLLQRRLTPAAQEWKSVKKKDEGQPKGVIDKTVSVFVSVYDLLDRGFLSPVESRLIKVPAQVFRRLSRSQNQQEGSRKKPVQFLWNADPYLDVLNNDLKSDDNWFNQVEAEFVQKSVLQKRQNISLWWRGAIAVMVGLSGLTIAALIQWRSSQLNLAESDGRYSLSLLNEHKDLEAFVQAIKSGKLLKDLNPIQPEGLNALQTVLVEGREKNRLLGHENSVTSVRFSPDGKTLASGSYDKTIKLWDLETGQFRNLKGHEKSVTSVSFSSDGKTLASGSNDGTIKLWNLETGKEIPTHMEHDSSVKSVSFSPDGKTLASGSTDGTIKLWNLETGQFRTVKGYAIHSTVWSVSFSPNGKTLASLSNDGTIKLWNVETAKAILTPKRQGHDSNDMSMSFSPDGKTLAYGSDDKTIKLWNLETGKEIPTLMKHDGPVQSVSFSPDGKTLASSDQGTIKLWNLETGIEIPTHMKHDGSVWSVSFSPDSKTLASGSTDYTIKIWNLEPGTEIPTLTGNKESFKSVSFSPDGKTLASGSDDKTIKLWNLETRKEIYTLQTGDYPVKRVSFSPDGKTLASLSNDGTIKLWNLETRKEIPLPLPLPDGHNNFVESVSFSPKGKTLAFGLYGKVIKLWNLETGKIRILQKQENIQENQNVHVYSVSFSLDGKTLASGNSNGGVAGTDNTIQLWNVETGKEIHTLPGHNNSVNSVSFSPDGKILASGSDDKTIKLWNVETGKEIYTLSGHNDPVQSVSFSPDGNTLASGSGLVDEKFPGTDNTIKLWNVETRTEIRTLKGHNDAITSVSFSPEGKTLASGSNDKTIKLWHLPDLEVEPLLEGSCAFVGAYLANPNSGMSKDDSDRHLCDGIGRPEQTQKISTGETTPVPNPKSPVLKAEVTPLDPKAAKEISELKGHQGSVRSVAFSHDGQTLATSGDDGTIRLWNIKGRQTFKFQGNQTAIRSIDFSPDDQKLVSDAGGKIRLWDLQGNLLREFVGSQKLIRSVKFNPQNGQQLASTGDDGTIHLWDLQGQSLAKWQADPKRVWDLEFSPDGQQIASAEAGGNVGLWDLQGKSLNQFTGHIYPVLSVAFSPDGKQLVSGCNVGMIRSWSLPDYQMINMFDVKHAEFNSVVYSLDSKLIVSGDNEGNIKMWKLNTQQQSPVWTAHQNSIIRKVAFSPNGNMFATAADDGIVKLWQFE